MYSRAKIAGHPIHPALVAFPVAFYVSTLVSLIVFEVNLDPFWYHVAAWTGLAGVVMGAVAAVPGLIDLLSIPAHTRARQTGIAHALLNVVTLLLFLIATISLWRHWDDVARLGLHAGVALACSAIGAVSLMAAGFLGWRLVQTFHVGVQDGVEADRLPETSGGVGGPLHHHPR